MHAADDPALLGRVRSGDAEALERLLARWADRVHRVAFGVTRDAQAAEEVAHAVFLRLVRTRRALETPEAFATWVYGEVARAALYRQGHAPAAALTPLLPAFAPDGRRLGEAAYLLADWSVEADAILGSEAGRAVVDGALARLPALERAVLILVDGEGLGRAQVAAAVGQPPATVAACLHRARMVVREALARHHAGS
jgi:RNA polymerase sigma-70 factor (ECF subfamily)